MQTKVRGEENVMHARMGPDAITIRLGAVALPLGIILPLIATAIHPHREDVMDNPVVFMEYAQSTSWIAVHFAQWLAALLLFVGLLGFTTLLERSRDCVQPWRALALPPRCRRRPQSRPYKP